MTVHALRRLERLPRNQDGSFDLRESTLEKYSAEVAPQIGQAGLAVPYDFKAAADTEMARLVRVKAEGHSAWALANPEQRSVIYLEALAQVSRDRPALVFMRTRTVAVDDSSRADVS